MNNNQKKTIKFLMSILSISLILLVGGNLYEYLFNKKPSREQVDNKIEVSDLQYVEFEDIKTRDDSIKNYKSKLHKKYKGKWERVFRGKVSKQIK